MSKTGPVRIVWVLLVLTLGYLAGGGFSSQREEATNGATYRQALALYRQGQTEECLEIISDALTVEPNSVALHNLAGWCHYRKNDLERAEREFLTSLDLDSDNAEALSGLGYVGISEGEHKTAFEYFKRALELSPTDRDALIGFGICLYHVGHLQRAREVFEYVLEKHPGDVEARDWLDKCSAEVTEAPSAEKSEYYSEPGGSSLLFRCEGDFFTLWDGDKFTPVFLKGVNLSATLPGGFPGDFNATEEDYRFFLNEISELGANVLRVYTLQPPRLYRALLEHNRRDGEKPLYLLQGVWVEPPPAFNYFDGNYLDDFKKGIKETIDAVYGNIKLKEAPGRPGGSYRCDVHEYLCGLVLGREWEPFTVVANDSINREINSYDGGMVSVEEGTATESWVAEILDFALSYEDSAYSWQHPVSFVNWPTLDPLTHPTEVPLRAESGEEVYNDDIVTLDVSKIRPTAKNRAGIFATYHVYPYHPDFMAVDPVYQHYRDEFGRLDSYRAYLDDLVEYHRGIPLLIGEYGVPSSRGNAHPHPQGLSHGGHSEREQGEIYARLTNDIWQSGCAGAVAFELLDEWFKKTWITYGREIPPENDPLWLNLQDPEENFGLLKVEPEPRIVIDGRGEDWRGGSFMKDKLGDAKGGLDLKALHVASDEAYLYLRLDLNSERIDWRGAEILLLVSTYSDEKGEHRVNLKSDRIDLPFGAEFALYLKSPWEGFLLEDDSYSSKEGDNRSDPNKDGLFVPIEHRVFREYPEGRQPPLYHEEGKLYYGDASAHPEQEPLVDFFNQDGIVEIRLPWALLKVSDPSSRQVLDYVGSSPREWKTYTTEGFKFLCLSLKPAKKQKRGELWENSRLVDAMPDLDKLKRTPSYLWERWEGPTYRIRRKAGFEYLREAFADLGELPRGVKGAPLRSEREYGPFDFNTLFDSSYESKEVVLARLEQLLQETENNFARADLHLIIERYRDGGPSISTADLYRLSGRERVPRKRLLSLLGAHSIEMLYKRSSDLTELLARYHSLAPKLTIWMQRKRAADSIKIPRPVCTLTGSRVIIGASRIEVPRGALVKTQVERVVRDWLSLYNLDLPPWEVDSSRIVPWHEGLSVKRLVEFAAVRVEPVWLCPGLKIGNDWYAPDMEGNFRFAFSPDKIYNYPTNKIVDRDLVVMNDTHGISAVAWDCEGAFLVIGCGDYPGKAEAAYYLAEKGINVLCPGDRFIPALLGTDTPGKVLGSAPIRRSESGATIGNQPLEIDLSEKIVISTTEKEYPVQYYDTPSRYFRELERYLNRKLNLTEFAVDYEGGTVNLIEFTKTQGATVVAVRVRTKEEYEAVRDWLRADRRHRAVLFHSSLYPEGYRLFLEFPEQTTFDDPYPVIR